CTTVAHAGWPAGGTRLMRANDSLHGLRTVRIFNLPSGDLVVLGVGTGGNALGYSTQRVSPLGDIAPGWPADGVTLAQVVSGYGPILHGFALDDSACFWHAVIGMVPGFSGTPSAQVEGPSGSVLPGPGGWAVLSGPNSNSYGGYGMGAALAPGGAYLAVQS